MLPTRVDLTPSNLERNSSFNLTWYPRDQANQVSYSVEVVLSYSLYERIFISDSSQSVILDLNNDTVYNISFFLSACSKEVNTTFIFSKCNIYKKNSNFIQFCFRLSTSPYKVHCIQQWQHVSK